MNIRNRFLAGVGVLVPIAVSAWVLLTLVRFVGSILSPISEILRTNGIESGTAVIILQLASVGIIGGVILAIGTIADRQIGKEIVEQIDDTISTLPGIGSVYQTARQMSNLLLDPDNGDSQFREVKLVEFPGTDTYTLGFLTSDSPPKEVVTTAQSMIGDENATFQTLFLPMAPNPVMGGHLTHIPTNQVHDIDMTIEQAVQYILTTGVVDPTTKVDTNSDQLSTSGETE